MKKILFIITFFVFSFSPKIYANDGVFNDGKTIKDLRKDIDNIEQIEINLDLKIKNFFSEYKLDSYLRKWLSDEEYQNLKKVVESYVTKNVELETKFQKLFKEKDLLETQDDLIEIRKTLYKNLVPFISSDKYREYIVYVENNIKNFIEKNTLQINKLKTQKTYNKKVDILERKIQENRENLDLELRKIIEEKVDEKLSLLIEANYFVNLSNETKLVTLEKVTENLILRKKDFEIEWNYPESDKKKLEIYNVMIAKLQEIIITLK